jgi:hypothetical protein
MISSLSGALRSLLDDAAAPPVVLAAQVAFDRPSESYNPDKTTINLFLFDVRENFTLRSSEPRVERRDGVVSIHQPPLRLDCSYLVTSWIESGVTGDEATLKQHELLGEVLAYLIGMPAIPRDRLQGALAQQPDPVPLTVPRGDLSANPAEFWSALGGKLRPSFTLTATIPIEQTAAPVTAFEVSTGRASIRDIDGGAVTVVHQIGGTVRRTDTRAPLAGVAVALPSLGRSVLTGDDGRFVVSGLAGGSIGVVAAKTGFATVSRTLTVPADLPTACDIDLSPNP